MIMSLKKISIFSALFLYTTCIQGMYENLYVYNQTSLKLKNLDAHQNEQDDTSVKKFSSLDVAKNIKSLMYKDLDTRDHRYYMHTKGSMDTQYPMKEVQFEDGTLIPDTNQPYEPSAHEVESGRFYARCLLSYLMTGNVHDQANKVVISRDISPIKATDEQRDQIFKLVTHAAVLDPFADPLLDEMIKNAKQQGQSTGHMEAIRIMYTAAVMKLKDIAHAMLIHEPGPIPQSRKYIDGIDIPDGMRTTDDHMNWILENEHQNFNKALKNADKSYSESDARRTQIRASEVYQQSYFQISEPKPKFQLKFSVYEGLRTLREPHNEVEGQYKNFNNNEHNENMRKMAKLTQSPSFRRSKNNTSNIFTIFTPKKMQGNAVKIFVHPTYERELAEKIISYIVDQKLYAKISNTHGYLNRPLIEIYVPSNNRQKIQEIKNIINIIANANFNDSNARVFDSDSNQAPHGHQSLSLKVAYQKFDEAEYVYDEYAKQFVYRKENGDKYIKLPDNVSGRGYMHDKKGRIMYAIPKKNAQKS